MSTAILAIVCLLIGAGLQQWFTVLNENRQQARANKDRRRAVFGELLGIASEFMAKSDLDEHEIQERLAALSGKAGEAELLCSDDFREEIIEFAKTVSKLASFGLASGPWRSKKIEKVHKKFLESARKELNQ